MDEAVPGLIRAVYDCEENSIKRVSLTWKVPDRKFKIKKIKSLKPGRGFVSK
jgi:hypothetical protein